MSTTDDQVKAAARIFAKMGGEAVKKKYGSKHFSELGKKAMKKRWANKKKKNEK